MPRILLSVRRIERFSVVTGPTGIIGIIAIFSPKACGKVECIDAENMAAHQPGRAACLIFASGETRPQKAGLRWTAGVGRAWAGSRM